VPHQRIEHRPRIVNERSRIGDWEGELVVGPMSRSAVATLVDRRSRHLRLVHLPDGHRADHLVTALQAALAATPAGKRLTLTCDQGSEMARPDQVAPLFSQGVFFASPGSPWMRGTNENTGLVLQYLRKGIDLSTHASIDLTVIEAKRNTRPRKILGWKTPRRGLRAGNINGPTLRRWLESTLEPKRCHGIIFTRWRQGGRLEAGADFASMLA
jgi:IS30 family transposase